MEELDTNLYSVMLYQNSDTSNQYKQYCSETLCNILGFTPALSVRLVYESIEKGKTLILCTRNIDKATAVRNTLLSMNIKCEMYAEDCFKNNNS